MVACYWWSKPGSSTVVLTRPICAFVCKHFIANFPLYKFHCHLHASVHSCQLFSGWQFEFCTVQYTYSPVKLFPFS